jgi:hypothetical protein
VAALQDFVPSLLWGEKEVEDVATTVVVRQCWIVSCSSLHADCDSLRRAFLAILIYSYRGAVIDFLLVAAGDGRLYLRC